VRGGPLGYAASMPQRHFPLELEEKHCEAWLDLWRRNCRTHLQLIFRWSVNGAVPCPRTFHARSGGRLTFLLSGIDSRHFARPRWSQCAPAATWTAAKRGDITTAQAETATTLVSLPFENIGNDRRTGIQGGFAGG